MTILFFILSFLSVVGLVVSLIKPTWTLRWLPPEKRTRKKAVLLHVVLLVIFGFGFMLS